jgi:hypothetical protein
MYLSVDRFVRRVVSALAALERASLQLPPRSGYGGLLDSALDFTRSGAELIVRHENRIKA